LGDEIKKYEMVGACIMYWGEEKHIEIFGRGNLRQRRYLEKIAFDGRKN
jgi:hypothetical protein